MSYVGQERRLNAFHLRSIRRILAISWQDKVTNADVLSRVGLHDVMGQRFCIFIVLFFIVQASILLCVAAPGRGREYAVLDYCAAQLFRGHLASLNETQTG